jgi:hypothetical protein
MPEQEMPEWEMQVQEVPVQEVPVQTRPGAEAGPGLGGQLKERPQQRVRLGAP